MRRSTHCEVPRAMRTLQSADVILYDGGISPAVLEFARRGYDELDAFKDLRPDIALGLGVIDIKDAFFFSSLIALFLFANYVYVLWCGRAAFAEFWVYSFIPWVVVGIVTGYRTSTLTGLIFLQACGHPIVLAQSLVCELVAPFCLSRHSLPELAQCFKVNTNLCHDLPTCKGSPLLDFCHHGVLRH